MSALHPAIPAKAGTQIDGRRDRLGQARRTPAAFGDAQLYDLDPSLRRDEGRAGVNDRYAARRAAIERYFDRTALDAWAKLTSDAPVSRIRQTVRAGRDAMRATLLGWLPDELNGRRVLDAGCGPGVMCIDLARRGAQVVGVDLSGELVRLAAARTPPELASRMTLSAGDMLDEGHGRFDHVVCMDALIHYGCADAVVMLGRLAARTERSILFTYAPKTPLLAVMHAVGRLFPRADRSPAIQPTAPRALVRKMRAEPALQGWTTGRTHRIKSGFYTCQALELVRR